ncbi:MAG: hypothetical protein ACKOBP_04525, partial [Planctomycetia bacterium]
MSGDGAVHNAFFRIEGNQVRVIQSLAAYSNTTLSIRVEVRYPDGYKEEQIVNISAVGNALLSDGLVGWWPLDGNGQDLSGNRNDGVVSGAVAGSDRFNRTGKAMQFNGVSDKITVPSSISISTVENNDGITIAGWMKADDFPLAVF